VILRGDEILLVERGREPLKGYWSLPGGVLEVGELAEAAVQREVLEETGLRVTIRGLVKVFERIQRDAGGRPEYHYVLLDYFCEPTGGDLRAGDDVSRAQWVRRAELPGFQLTEGALPVIDAAFAMRGAEQ
jgi:ADP-ribose pyrophosphatase YjhB (NUDIX family)